MSFGVYIHFPFCRRRCGYCDFASEARAEIPHVEYADAVVRELEERAGLYAGRALASVYFGGGTPGLWEAASVARVLAEVRCRFAGAGEPEVTLEANPGEIDRAHFAALCAAGVNRISLGVQSLDDRRLVRLGRIHDAAQARAAVANARLAGFANLSLDLIYGLPEQTPADLERDLDGLLALAPDHVSLYCLTLDEKTPLGRALRRGELRLPGSEIEAEMYERLQGRMREAGFEHYEISNFARPGRRAVHNTLYWSGGEWLGLGASAHSMRLDGRGGAERTATVATARYLEELRRAAPLDRARLIAEREILDEDDLAREAMWLGLRLVADGIDEAAYASRFGSTPQVRFGRAIDRLCAAGLLEERHGRWRLTPRGVLLADEVAAEFL